MKRRESLLVAVCIGVLFFFLFRFALVDCIEIWQTIESILGSLHPFMQSHVCIIALLTCCSLITALLTYQICIGKIHVLLLYFITALYLLLIFAIIMLKSRGISGFNVNPLLIVQELLQAPLTVLFNMLAFMPIGFMLAWKCQSPKVTILLFLAFITICELIQSILHLGIFDVDDILLNTFGFALGFLAQNHADSRGWSMQRQGNFVTISKR
ncbi:VanZ family protein [Bifidobacterium dentium]|uniref:VanZ family protein n=1 Tax=Bifidobacterium dentium TaxID=1689 RepID=UPI0022E992B0|nr:VanZ family protein [Bifidobacterium dentium]